MDFLLNGQFNHILEKILLPLNPHVLKNLSKTHENFQNISSDPFFWCRKLKQNSNQQISHEAIQWQNFTIFCGPDFHQELCALMIRVDLNLTFHHYAEAILFSIDKQTNLFAKVLEFMTPEALATFRDENLAFLSKYYDETPEFEMLLNSCTAPQIQEIFETKASDESLTVFQEIIALNRVRAVELIIPHLQDPEKRLPLLLTGGISPIHGFIKQYAYDQSPMLETLLPYSPKFLEFLDHTGSSPLLTLIQFGSTNTLFSVLKYTGPFPKQHFQFRNIYGESCFEAAKKRNETLYDLLRLKSENYCHTNSVSPKKTGICVQNSF